MNAFIADSFHLDPAPTSAGGSLIDLVAEWEVAFIAAERLHGEHKILAKAMEKAGLDSLCFATVPNPSGKPVTLSGGKSPEDPVIVDEWIGRQRGKYLWNDGQFELFHANTRAAYFRQVTRWHEVAASLGYEAVRDACEAAWAISDPLQDQIASMKPRTTAEMVALLRYSRMISIKQLGIEDDEPALRVIESVIDRLTQMGAD